jgi:hypothetical protein
MMKTHNGNWNFGLVKFINKAVKPDSLKRESKIIIVVNSNGPLMGSRISTIYNRNIFQVREGRQ